MEFILFVSSFMFFCICVSVQHRPPTTTELLMRLQQQIDNVADGVNTRIDGVNGRIDAVNSRITTITVDTRNLKNDVLLIYNELRRVESQLNDTLKTTVKEEDRDRTGSREMETVRKDAIANDVESEVLKLKNGFQSEKVRAAKYRRSLTQLEEKVTKYADVLDRISSNAETVGNIIEEIHTRVLPSVQEGIGNVLATSSDANRSCHVVEKLDLKLESNDQMLTDVKQAVLNTRIADLENITSSLNVITALSKDVFAITEQHWIYERVSNRRSCAELLVEGYTESNVYKVTTPVGVRSLFCDLNDGGGWMVIQRRVDGTENFFREWGDYKAGFGNISGEFWLGNDLIHKFTSWWPHELHIELEDFDNKTRYAKYGTFEVGPESDNYRLKVGDYSGNAGDALSGVHHNGQQFSTYDRDNDDDDGGNCAATREGGWWFGSCASCHLNGPYRGGRFTDMFDKGITWDGFRNELYSLKSAEMKIRPK